MPLSEVFWVAFVTTMTGFILKLVSMAYKSKCKSCKLGCIEVIRDVDAEVELDEMRIVARPPPNSPKSGSTGDLSDM
jgi:hypothetical protein